MRALKSVNFIPTAALISTILMVIMSYNIYPYDEIILWRSCVFFSLVLFSIVLSLLILRRINSESRPSSFKNNNESALYDSWATRVGALSVVYGLTILKGSDNSRIITDDSALAIIYIVVVFLAIGAIESIYKYAREVVQYSYKNINSLAVQLKLIINLVGVISSAIVILFISIPEVSKYFGYYDPNYHGFIVITVLTAFSSGLALIRYSKNKIKNNA